MHNFIPLSSFIMFEYIYDGNICLPQEEMKFKMKWRGEGDIFTPWLMLQINGKYRWAEC